MRAWQRWHGHVASYVVSHARRSLPGVVADYGYDYDPPPSSQMRFVCCLKREGPIALQESERVGSGLQVGSMLCE